MDDARASIDRWHLPLVDLMQLPPLADTSIRDLVSDAIARAGWATKRFALPRIVKQTYRSTQVYASRGRAKIVVEILNSKHVSTDIRARQAQYDLAGIRCLWLTSFHTFPVDRDLPAASVRIDALGEVIALLPSRAMTPNHVTLPRQQDWAQSMPLGRFIHAAFAGHLWYGTVRAGHTATIRLDGGFTKCGSCGEWTNLCAAIEIIPDDRESTFALYAIDQVPATILSELLPPSLASLKVGAVSQQPASGAGPRPVVNSCVRCGAIQDAQALAELHGRYEPIAQFSTTLSRQVADVAAELATARWRVSEIPRDD